MKSNRIFPTSNLGKMEDDMGLETALKKARRLQQRKAVTDVADRVMSEVKIEIKKEEEVTGSEFIATFEEDAAEQTIILNETAEFCRNLGARAISAQAESRQGPADIEERLMLTSWILKTR